MCVCDCDDVTGTLILTLLVCERCFFLELELADCGLRRAESPLLSGVRACAWGVLSRGD